MGVEGVLISHLPRDHLILTACRGHLFHLTLRLTRRLRWCRHRVPRPLPGFPGARCRVRPDAGTGEAEALFAVAGEGAPSRTAGFRREGGGGRQQHQAGWPAGARVAQRQALQAPLALGRLSRSVQGSQQRGGWRAGAAQQEVEARAVPRIVEERPGGRVRAWRPGERERQRKVLGEHPDSEVVLFAQSAVGAPDAAEMRLPELRVAAVDVGEARRGGRNRTCGGRDSQRGRPLLSPTRGVWGTWNERPLGQKKQVRATGE